MTHRNLLAACGLLLAACFIGFVEAQNKTDQNGDALPPGALARMGTMRWRHGDVVTFVAATPDGKAVLTASQDGILRLWDRATGKVIRRFDVNPGVQPGAGPRAGVMVWSARSAGTGRIALSQDGKFFAIALPNNAIQQWDVETGKEIRQIKGPQTGANTIVISPDGKAIAVRGYDGATHVLETATGNEILQIKNNPPAGGARVLGGGGGNGAAGVAFSPDGKAIATAEMEFNINNMQRKLNTYVKITGLKDGKEILQIDSTPNTVAGLAYSPDGKILAHTNGNTIYLRDAANGKEIRQITLPSSPTKLLFAPDSKAIAAKGHDQIIRVFETANGKSIHSLGDAVVAGGNQIVFVGGMSSEARDFAFTDQGKTIVAGAGQTVRFFNLATGKEQASAPSGHHGPVLAVVMTPDGKTLVSRGADHVIRRWDAVTGKELGSLAEPKGTTGSRLLASDEAPRLPSPMPTAPSAF